MPPLHAPGTAASTLPTFAAPTIVGGTLVTGGPVVYVPIASGPGSGPAYRSPSTQLRKPGTFAQSVHCQNVHPRPPQLPAGSDGDPFAGLHGPIVDNPLGMSEDLEAIAARD